VCRVCCCCLCVLPRPSCWVLPPGAAAWWCACQDCGCHRCCTAYHLAGGPGRQCGRAAGAAGGDCCAAGR
jgi:hypothetical protein